MSFIYPAAEVCFFGRISVCSFSSRGIKGCQEGLFTTLPIGELDLVSQALSLVWVLDSEHVYLWSCSRLGPRASIV